MTQFKHAYTVITADFEIEPVLEEYFERFPEGQYEDYQIVFKTQDEHEEGQYSYIIVFTRNTGMRATQVKFYDLLKQHCECHTRRAAMSPVSGGLPTVRDGHAFYNPLVGR